MTDPLVRLAGVADAAGIAAILHDFNEEFDVPAPEVDWLTRRVADLLSGDATFAVVAGDEAIVALGLVTLRPNVWFSGPVALLDEMVVTPSLRGRGIGTAVIDRVVSECTAKAVALIEINVDEPDVDAQRFYRRHGFRDTEPGTSERAFYFWRDLVT